MRRDNITMHSGLVRTEGGLFTKSWTGTVAMDGSLERAPGDARNCTFTMKVDQHMENMAQYHQHGPAENKR